MEGQMSTTSVEEPSEALIEVFRDQMTHRFGLYTTPEDARWVVKKLLQQLARENGK